MAPSSWSGDSVETEYNDPEWWVVTNSGVNVVRVPQTWDNLGEDWADELIDAENGQYGVTVHTTDSGEVTGVDPDPEPDAAGAGELLEGGRFPLGSAVGLNASISARDPNE